jgi:hypothetical protein
MGVTYVSFLCVGCTYHMRMGMHIWQYNSMYMGMGIHSSYQKQQQVSRNTAELLVSYETPPMQSQ